MQLEQAHPNGIGVKCEFLLRQRQDVFDTDGDKDAVDRLARPAFLQDVQERQPAILVGLAVGVLGRVAAGGIDQHRLLGEPPIAVARTADPRDRCGRRPARERKFEPGIDQRRGLAGSGRTDDDVPRQIVEIARLVAAGGLQRRERILHALLEHRFIADGLVRTSDAIGNLLGTLAPLEQIEANNACHDRGEQQNSDLPDDMVLQRPPVAERDEGTGEIDHRSERAEPYSVENDAKNVLGKHLTVPVANHLTRRYLPIRCVR
ncbi:hypothetical protein ACVWXQ_004156 [Bradyrhizobium sp. S3.14.4]